MLSRHNSENPKFLEHLTYQSVKLSGSPATFLLVFCFTLAWLAAGPFLKFSERWQLIMNTVSSTFTFLMVFLLQRAQSKDTLAMQIKLNEVIASLKGANNHLINIENLSETEILELQKRYQTVAEHLHEKPKDNVSTGIIDAHEMAKHLERPAIGA